MGQAALSMIRPEDDSNDLSPDKEPKHDSLVASHSRGATPDLSELEDSYTTNSNDSTAYTTSQYSKQHQVPLEKAVDHTVFCIQSSTADGLDSDILQRQSWPGCNPGVIHLPSLQRDMYSPLYSFYRRTTSDIPLPQPPFGVSTASTSSNYKEILSTNDSNDASSSDIDDDNDDGMSGVYYDAMEEPSEMATTLTSTQINNSLSSGKQSMRQPCDSIILGSPVGTLSSSLFKDGPIHELRKSFINDITSLSRTRPFVNKTIRSNVSCGQQPIQSQQETALDCHRFNNGTPQVSLKVDETSNRTNVSSTGLIQLTGPRKILPLPASLRKKHNQHSLQSQANRSVLPLQAALQQPRTKPTECTFKASSIGSEERKANTDSKVAHTKEHHQLKSDIDEEYTLTNTNISNNESACNINGGSSTNKTSKVTLSVSPRLTCNIPSTPSTPQHTPLVQPSSKEDKLAPKQSSSTSLKKKKNEKYIIPPSTWSKTNDDSGIKGNEQLVYPFRGKERNGEHSGSQRSITQRKMTNNEYRNDNRLDLVALPRNLDDEWVCLFCQYEIFQRGWMTAQEGKRHGDKKNKKRSGRKQADAQLVAATSATTTQGVGNDITF